MRHFSAVLTAMLFVCMSLGAQTVNVTFQVNMTYAPIVSADGVHIAGNFQSWNPATSLMEDPDGDLIFTFTAAIPINSEVQYKFVNGNAWGFDEAVPAACGVDNGQGGYNRVFNVADTDFSLDPVCFGGCEDCGIFVAVPGDECINANLAFLGINHCDTIVYPSALAQNATYAKWFVFTPMVTGNHTVSSCGGGIDTRVYMLDGACDALTFLGLNDDACEMTPDNPDLYASKLILPLVAGTPYYIVWDDAWDASPFDFYIEEGGVILSATVSVDMANTEASADGVYIVGNTINQPTLMTNVSGTVWEYTIPDFQPGDVVAYIFSNSADFSDYELNVPDECGTYVANIQANARFFFIGATDTIIPTVCYNECGPCQNIVYYNVTLEVDMAAVIANGGTVSADGIHVAGSFQDEAGFPADWEPGTTALTQVAGTDKYAGTFTLLPGQYEYKFVNGNAWGQDEVVEGGCVAPGGFGNRLLDLTADITQAACFGYCVNCEVVLGTSDAAFDSAFRLSPNPTKDLTTLSINLETATDLQIRLTNSLGQTVQQQQLSNVQQSTVALDMANLPAGVYVLQLANGSHVTSKRIVVQK